MLYYLSLFCPLHFLFLRMIFFLNGWMWEGVRVLGLLSLSLCVCVSLCLSLSLSFSLSLGVCVCVYMHVRACVFEWLRS